jgi:acyl-coenzyme A thioesterase PaaI-like protein
MGTEKGTYHFYDERGGCFVPTELVTGPWNPKLQGGVPLAALLVHLIERVPTIAPMVTTRVLIDLVRPTAMQAMEARANVLRDGKRVQIVEAEIISDGVVTAKASALRVRAGETPVLPQPLPGAPPESARSFISPRSKITHLLDTRLVSGGLEELGPGTVWTQIRGEIVRGVAISPLVGAAMCADFGSGLSSVLDYREWSFANVDLTLHLSREPAEGWLKLEASTLTAGNGIAVVHGLLSDEQGSVGHTHQTLFLERTRA